MKIVASVSSLSEAEQASSLPSVDVIELRLDLFDTFPSVEFVKELTKAKILTIRKVEDGGQFIGNDEERLEIYGRYAEACQYADVETGSYDAFFDLPCTIIESYHNFSETPSYNFLADLIDSSQGDIFKIAVMGRSKKDVVTICRILSEYESVVAFLMGREFSYTRILAVLMGAPFIYCHTGSAVVSGQIHVKTADKILRLLGVR
jgi:3-dehydroquinate dehydratase-1